MSEKVAQVSLFTLFNGLNLKLFSHVPQATFLFWDIEPITSITVVYTFHRFIVQCTSGYPCPRILSVVKT